MDEIEAKTANGGNDYIINIKQKEFGTNREEFYRKVNMPYATRFIAEHDLWCFDNPVVKPFILGIGNFDIIKHSDYVLIDEIMHVQDDSTTDYDQILDIIKDGTTILNDRIYNLYPAMMKSSVSKKFDTDQITNPVSDDVREKISKLTAVVLEMPGCFNSDVFGEARNTADVCVKYHFTSNGVTYTFYTTANSPVNARTLAEAYGGGGHIHAAGTHRDADKTILI
jgi:oligoribonuclease NrnB/cAMP/cGMP phosphodiesterase (DHH superfamily)